MGRGDEMNILNHYIMKKIEAEIRRGARLKEDLTAFSQFKKEINSMLGVFYIKYMPTKDTGAYTVIVKRRTKQYIYYYNRYTEEFVLKGERGC